METQSLYHTTWLPAASLCWRELIRFYRYPSRVVGALGTPLIFWLLIGSGIGTSFQSQGAPNSMTYLEYFFPGTLMLILLFTSIFCMISVIEDRHEGFLLSVLVAPISRRALVLGKILGGSVVALLQGILFVLLAPTVGISLHAGNIPLLVGVLLLVAIVLTGLGFMFAWLLDSVQGFHAVANLFLIPLWLLSGALFPSAGASPWVRWLMKLNPLTYATDALRQSLYLGSSSGGADVSSLALSLTITAGFAVVVVLAAFAVANRPLRGNLG